MLRCLTVGLLFGAARCPAAAVDFDGDGKTDPAVYYPASGTWVARLSKSGAQTSCVLGGPDFLPAPGDYDGDRKADLVAYSASRALWLARLSGGQSGQLAFGRPGDWPVPADYDGDGRTDPAVYNPRTGVWTAQSLSGGWTQSVAWGYLGDFRPWERPQTYTVLPMPFDYNQDGRDDPGYYYRGTAMTNSGWHILYSGSGAVRHYTWGSSGSLPAPGNYQMAVLDAPRGICVYKVTTAEWFTPYRHGFQAGLYGRTLPVPGGDYDGNGYEDHAYYDYTTGDWTVVFNNGGTEVEGRPIQHGRLGGAGAVPANLYSTLYALARYSVKPW